MTYAELVTVTAVLAASAVVAFAVGIVLIRRGRCTGMGLFVLLCMLVALMSVSGVAAGVRRGHDLDGQARRVLALAVRTERAAHRTDGRYTNSYSDLQTLSPALAAAARADAATVTVDSGQLTDSVRLTVTLAAGQSAVAQLP